MARIVREVRACYRARVGCCRADFIAALRARASGFSRHRAPPAASRSSVCAVAHSGLSRRSRPFAAFCSNGRIAASISPSVRYLRIVEPLLLTESGGGIELLFFFRSNLPRLCVFIMGDLSAPNSHLGEGSIIPIRFSPFRPVRVMRSHSGGTGGLLFLSVFCYVYVLCAYASFNIRSTWCTESMVVSPSRFAVALCALRQ